MAPMAPVDDNLTSRNFRHVDETDFTVPTSFSSNRNFGFDHDHDQQQEQGTTGPISTSEPRMNLPQEQQIVENDDDLSVFNLFSMSSAPLSYFSVNEQMPTWLRPSGNEAENKLSKLRETMISSYLSQAEADLVISAIRESSSGDLNQMAGAADFSLLLVETMEMGANTLIAGAFHYCECFVARQKGATLNPSAFVASDYWADVSAQDNEGRRIKFGDDAHRIASDAARIKRTEMVAGQSLRLKPTAKDSENMRKMLLSETKDWRALALRSAGCLYRLQGIYQLRESSGENILLPKEINVAHVALAIYAPLASRMGMHRLKNEIEGAAFRVLYRRQYEKVIALTLQQKPCDRNVECSVTTLNEGMTIILDRVTDEVKTLLDKDPCFQKYAKNVKVTARIKEPYSLWKKMLKLGASQVLDVPDTLALRVVLEGKKMSTNEDDEVTRARERALCYYALKKCTKTFEPREDGRFKDYICNPKANGYQSLHYTASTKFDGQEWPFEIQVRSSEMHQVAEFGLAAHWDYKEQGKPSNNVKKGTETKDPHFAFHLDQSSDAYLRSVQNWHWQQVHGQSSWKTDTSSEEEEIGEVSERLRKRDERLAPYLKALMADQSNLTREQVFIFLQSQENGITLALPAGSCVLDALRESERTLGLTTDRHMEKNVEHNGCRTSVTQKLNNGDILTIPLM